MSHPELAIAGFYDHEQHTTQRAPDWGGDDLFTSAPPRRRFERAMPPRRRDALEHPWPHDRPVAREDAPALDRTNMSGAQRTGTLYRAGYVEPVPEGRRTVTITGRPASLAVTRRPARTLDDRLAHRPERIASWTCAMGFLLILLAVLTSH